MFRTRRQLWPVTAVVLTLALLGCGGGPQDDPMAAEWDALQAAKTALDAKRQELATLVAEAAAPVDPEAEGEPVDHSAHIEALGAEITGMADSFMTQVVTFLNNDPIIWTMLNGIKELSAENRDLKDRLGKLEQLVQSLADGSNGGQQ